METTPSRSHLQKRLLLALRTRPSNNLAALARELDVQRSSVSRAIHALRAESLVVKDGSVWQLTQAGETAADRVREELPEHAQRTGRTIRRLIDQSRLAGSSTDPLVREMLAPLREIATSALSTTRDLMANFAAIPKPSHGILAEAAQFEALKDVSDTAAEMARILAPAGSTELAIQTFFNPEQQAFVAINDTIQSYLAEHDRSFFEVTQSLAADIVDKAQLTSAYQTFLTKGSELVHFSAAYDTIAAQLAVSAHAYQSAVARLVHGDVAAATVERLATHFANLAPATRLFDLALPSPTMLAAIKDLALVPSPVEFAASYLLPENGAPVASFGDIGSRLAREAMSSFAESLRLNLALIEQATGWERVSTAIIGDLSAINEQLGNVLSDLGAMYSCAFVDSTRSAFSAVLMPDVAAVARTYRGYLSEIAVDLTRRESDLDHVSVILSTKTTADLIHTTRAAVVIEHNEVDKGVNSPSPRRSPWTQQAGFVDVALERQGLQFLRLWHGSWAVLSSDSPDRVRQAAHSGRELLLQILAVLAPDSAFSADDLKQCQVDKPTRKMRVRRILVGRSSATIHHVESIAKALDDLYDRLAGISHDRSPDLTTSEYMIACWLMTLGGLLAMLLGEEQ